MLTKLCSLILVLLLVNVTCVSWAVAGERAKDNLSKTEKKLLKHAAKIKTGVEKLGTGEDSVVQIKLRDKQELTGYVSKIGEDDFTIVDADGTSSTIEYKNAKQIKGNNLHSGAWIAIGFGLAMAAFLIVLVVLKAKES